MRVAAVEQELFLRLMALKQWPLRARIAVKYRHGLDLSVDGVQQPIFISTATKGLFPSHMVVASDDLDILLNKPVDSLVWLMPEALDAHRDDGILTLSHRLFDLRLRFAFDGEVDAIRLGQTVSRYRSLLTFVAICGGLAPLEEIFSPSWVYRAAFDLIPETKATICSLLGCGVGSTPAGDDMLVGAASACYVVSSQSDDLGERAQQWLRVLGECQPQFEQRTTLMSCGYLNAALTGRFGSHLIGLHQSFFGLRQMSLLTAMMKVKRHGSTSGVDALVGVYLGYRMLTKFSNAEYS